MLLENSRGFLHAHQENWWSIPAVVVKHSLICLICINTITDNIPKERVWQEMIGG